MRIAIVSDIHGNLTALEAVLADLRQASPDLILHGGDLADNGSSPVEGVDRIRDFGWHGVMGNTDEMLVRPKSLEEFASQSSAPASLWAVIRQLAEATRRALGEERLTWLGRLPAVQAQPTLALVHASPDSCWRVPQSESPAELQAVYGPLGQPIVVHAHTHRPSIRSLPGLPELLVNTGSVGLSYDGDPRAAYLLVTDGVPDSTSRVRPGQGIEGSLFLPITVCRVDRNNAPHELSANAGLCCRPEIRFSINKRRLKKRIEWSSGKHMFAIRVCCSPRLIALLSASLCAMYAQAPLSNKTISFNNGVHALKVSAIEGAPFSASEELSTSQVLSDGTTVMSRMRLQIVRDTQGRTHQESRYFQAPYDNGDARIKSIILFDPSTRTRATLDPATQIARLLMVPVARNRQLNYVDTAHQQDLGFTTLEGESVQGTRYTRSIAAGIAGNDQPIVITDEIWYSRALQINILMKQVDPRHPTVTMRLTGINRGEPAARMFQIPDGYRIITEPVKVQ